MRKTKNIFLSATAFLLALGCSEDDKITLDVQENVARGAVLRTITNTGSYNMFDLSREFNLTIEEQDVELGALLDRVEMTLSFVDNNVPSGGTDNSVDKATLATVPASDFTAGDSGLPRFDYTLTLQQALTTTGIDITEILPGDQFVMDLELFLTDGNSYSAADATGNVSGGSFFSSPFQYTKTISDGISFLLPFQNDGINVADKTGINIAEGAVNDDYSVTVLIDDDNDGDLLETLNIYREFIDRTVEEGDPNLSEEETLFETYDISSLTSDEGVRTLELTYTLDQLYGSDIEFDDLGVNDEFRLRYEIITADGRVVTTTSDGTEYFVLINVLECKLLNADAPFPGEYTINFFDSFGGGWDGATIDVSVDGSSVGSFTILGGGSGSRTFTVPEGATSLEVTYVPGDFEEEHSYVILDPNGNQAAADPGGALGPVVGPIGIAVCE
ncbi:hypothetical protein [Flagellimonas onchidii]|uniref:hypothetical protein n=1 Tax=Flagellimonas onchidii TaxID=2562684 RepID=UPI0010A609B3|nr:hypothetical protein [Allomuricauda onchidii]